MKKENLKPKSKIYLILIGIIFSLISVELVLQGIAYFNSISNSHPVNINKNTKQTIILCMGDSFTFGIGAKKGYSYPEQLQQILNQKYPPKQFKVLNAGQPGFNTVLTVQKTKKMIGELSPDILIIMTGANDYWNLSGIDRDSTNIFLKLNSLMYNFRVYRLMKIYLNNAQQKDKTNNRFKLNSISNMKKRLKQDEFERAMTFILRVKYARTFLLSKDYEKSLIALDRALSIHYLDEYIFESLDELFINWSDFSKAIAYYEKLNNMNPNDKKVLIRLARIYKAVQDYKKSYSYYRKLLMLDPESREAAVGMDNAKSFLNQNIFSDYVIDKQSLPLVCQQSFNSDDVFDKSVDLTDKDLGLLRGITALSKSDCFVQAEDYRKYLDDIYKNELQTLDDLCARKKIRILILSYPNFVRDYVREGFKNSYADFIDLRPRFLKIVNDANRNEYESADGHCTGKGYELIAETVCNYIKKNNK